MVDFKNTVIIMTTNLGTRDITKGVFVGFGTAGESRGSYDRMKTTVEQELKQHFRPEFLNRVDDTIVFRQLSREEILTIVDLMIAKVDERLKDRDMGLELLPAARTLLSERGYDPVLGARPLRRTIQREIEDNLSEKILFGELRAGQIVTVDVEGTGRQRSSRSRAWPGPSPRRKSSAASSVTSPARSIPTSAARRLSDRWKQRCFRAGPAARPNDGCDPPARANEYTLPSSDAVARADVDHPVRHRRRGHDRAPGVALLVPPEVVTVTGTLPAPPGGGSPQLGAGGVEEQVGGQVGAEVHPGGGLIQAGAGNRH